MILEDCDDFSRGIELFSGLAMILEDCDVFLEGGSFFQVL
jgi:hypothetical protein